MDEEKTFVEATPSESQLVGKPTYIMIPRKMVRTWIAVSCISFILNIASFQYTNYVDRKSNGLWCGIVVLFDDTYKTSPPPSPTGQVLAGEFSRIRDGFRCK